MAANISQIGFIACASTNVTSTSYVQINFGTEAANPATYPNTPISCGKLQITDTSGKILKIASGASGSQVDMYTCSPNGSIIVNQYLAPNTSLWAKAIDSTNNASTGYISVSLVP